MRPKLFLLFICLIGLIGCLPAREPVAVTRPVIVTTFPTEAGVSTAVSPTNTPQPTATQVADATATPTSLPTSTPEPAWPTTPILFVRDGMLQRWVPLTNEIEVLFEGVDSHPIFRGEFAIFLRTTGSEQLYDLIAYHIPTQTETFVDQVPAQKLVTEAGTSYNIPAYTITVSPNGRWIGFVTENSDTIYLTLSLYELVLDNNTFNVQSSPSIPIDILRDSYFFYFASFTWIDEDQVSWATSSGMWGLNLESSAKEPVILIQPSTNTYEHPGAVDENGNYLPQRTSYLPYGWSPDGRYLIAREDGYEGGIFRVIERETDRTVAIPDADYGAYSDALIWVTNDSFLHFNLSGTVTHWQVRAEESFALHKIESFQFKHGLFDNLSQISGGHIRFSYSLLVGSATSWIYDLNLETGEFTQLSLDLESREIIVRWSPSNEEILWQSISGPSTPLFYNSLDGQTSIDLDGVFGPDSCCWRWESSGSE